jgi:predicted metal-dependent phosphoesterase TrpH
MTGPIDLHIHTRYSDGMHTPSEIIALAKASKLSTIAITDHDSIDGVLEGAEAGQRLGISVIAGVELSVAHEEFDDVHLLGYHIDPRDQQFQELLRDIRQQRYARGLTIVANVNQMLKEEGVAPINAEALGITTESALGRPHIARLLVAHGVATSQEDAFSRYLIPANVAKHRLPIAEALTEIHRMGGVAVLAHPFSITSDRHRLATIVNDLSTLGMDGLEVFTNLCYKDDSIFLAGLARARNLVITGGSDFHGDDEGNILGRGRGNLAIPAALAKQLLARSNRGRKRFNGDLE